MNKTYKINILRTVKSSLSRFLSIFAIVALGVGFLSGLLSTTPDMRLSADGYCDDTNMMDIHLLSTLGLNEEDLTAVRAIPGVAAVQPAYDSDALLCTPGGQTIVTRMHSLPRGAGDAGDASMNRLRIVEGRMPQTKGECVVVQSNDLNKIPAKVGDVLRLAPENKKPEDTFAVRDFTVVGTAKSAYYMSVEREHSTLGNGTVELLAYTPETSFSLDIYTGFYLTATGAAPLNAFSADYDHTVELVTDQLKTLADTRAPLRYKEVINEANTALSDAKLELSDAKTEADEKLADAAKKLADGRRKLVDAERTLADAAIQIKGGQAELDRNKDDFAVQIPKAQTAIADGRTKLADGKKRLADGRKTLEATAVNLQTSEANIAGLEAGKASLFQLAASMGLPTGSGTDSDAIALLQQLLPGISDPAVLAQLSALQGGLQQLAGTGKTVDSARAELEAGKTAYAGALAALQANEALLAQQEAQLTAAESELGQKIAFAQTSFAEADRQLVRARAAYADGQKELADARVELDDGEREYTDKKQEAEEKISDAEEQILDAEAEIRDIENCKWYAQDRHSNLSFESYASNADKIEAIARVFPIFFFLVAALVALTTMTRMVEEERPQIGTLKALGYSNGKIVAKYLLYAGFAGLLGSVCGLLVGMRLFPTVIINAYNIMYEIPKALTPFNRLAGLSSAAAMIGCALLATLSACSAELHEVPARLMLPKAPKAGKRVFLEYITPLWSRMKFTHKVTARNLIRYKKRFFMTVIGIAGCTALLVTGFGIRDSVSDIVSKQFDDLYHYNLIVGLKNKDALNGRDLNALRQNSSLVEDSISVLQEDDKIVPKNGKPQDSIYLLAPSDTAHYKDFFDFRHRTNDTPVVFDDNAVIISEKLAERQSLAVGDTITVINKDQKEASFVITDICENYVQHYVFLSQKAYANAFGTPAQDNMLLVRAPFDEATQNKLAGALLECRDIALVQRTSELSVSFSNSIRSINYIVVVLIISAGALAFVVLYNLTNINITERSKELATIKVLGFYEREVAAYIYRETAVLSIIGTALGLFLGVFLHMFVIRTAEIDMVMFGRSIYAPSYLYAALLTLLFSALVALVMLPKLNHISMVESMKAPE